jgi:Domain of unknown function (DUF4055)
MAVDNKHPNYTTRLPDWEQMAQCYAGERIIKQQRTKYLPATAGMILDGLEKAGADGGKDAYEAYLIRAVFPDFVKQGIEAMVGIMHREDARIEVPDVMKPLLTNISGTGESVQMFLRRMNEWQLLFGRAGILADVPSGVTVDKAVPYLSLYAAPRIINWDDGPRIQGRQRLEFVILDESDDERTSGFEWEFKNRYRVCEMSDAIPTNNTTPPANPTDNSGGVYRTAKVEQNDADLTSAQWTNPAIGGKTLDAIPFIFVNTKDLASNPDDPPLLGLSNLCLAIYRGEADFRQNLHMQGQDTFVIIGADNDPKTRLGAGARVSLPRDGDAKFVGVAADGLQAQKEAIEGDKNLAQELTSRLFDSTGTSYQSGEALRIRVSAKTATLRTIALTGAEAMRQALVLMGRWMGVGEEELKKIVVEPNTDFADTSAASRTALELAQAAQLGSPMSQKSQHRFLVQRGLTVLSFEEEMEEIKQQEPVIPQQGLGGQAAGGLGRATGGERVKRGVDDAPESKA